MASETGTISGVSYAKITNTLSVGEFWLINPYDLSGNLLSEITIEVDTTLGDVSVGVPYIEPYDIMNAPYYSTNGNTNINIKIIKVSPDPNIVVIETTGGTIFSGANVSSQQFEIDGLGDSFSITPIGTKPLYEVLLNWRLQ